MIKTVVVSKPRKLKARWTVEQIADLGTYYSIDAEKDLVDALSFAIRQEIDAEFVDKLHKKAREEQVQEYKEAWIKKGIICPEPLPFELSDKIY